MTLVSATSAIFSEIKIPFEGSNSSVAPEHYMLEVYQSVRPETQLKLKSLDVLHRLMIPIFL
jgi:hypothetical protein